MKIDPADLIGDPLYQCNLLLWMLQPSTGVVVKPLLQQAGYTLRFIEPKLPLPLTISNKLKTDKLLTADEGAPDMIIQGQSPDYVIIECKRSMFGYKPGEDDTATRQCRAFLLQVPQIFSEALPSIPRNTATTTHLLYLACHNTEVPQFTGVEAIAKELVTKNYQATTHGLLTLDISQGSIGLRKTGTHGAIPAPLGSALSNSFTPVQTIPDADTDPRPMYYIPWMPDSEPTPDAYNYNSFANRILLSAAAEIGPAIPPCDVELETEVLLAKATNEFYQYWRNNESKRHLGKRAKDLLKKQIFKADPKAVLKPLGDQRSGWKLTLMDTKMQSRIVEELRKWQSEVWLTPPTLKEQELFPE
jgi:hypothetical protein